MSVLMQRADPEVLCSLNTVIGDLVYQPDHLVYQPDHLACFNPCGQWPWAPAVV